MIGLAKGLDEAGAETVTAPEGGGTEEDDNDQKDGDDDPLNPGEGNGSVELTAVGEVGEAARKTTAEGRGEGSGTGKPEDPAEESAK